MLMRFDPYREFDRLDRQLASTASQAPRAFPMDGYRRGDQFIIQVQACRVWSPRRST